MDTPIGAKAVRAYERRNELSRLCAELRSNGAAEWLIDKIWQAGPTDATLRTARNLLGNPERIARLNAMARGVGA